MVLISIVIMIVVVVDMVERKWCYVSAGDVDAEIGRRGESAAVVLLRFEDDDVEFGSEEENERDHGAERDTDAKRDGLGLAAEVDGHESHPDDTGGVHGETDELGLVKVLGQVAGLDGVDGAHSDQKEIEAQRCHEAPDGGVAYDQDSRTRREVFHCIGRFDDEHHHDQRRFDQDHHRRYQDLAHDKVAKSTTIIHTVRLDSLENHQFS